jgi:hypothetical protein
MIGEVCTWCQQEMHLPPVELASLRAGSQLLPAGALLQNLAAGHKSKSRYELESEG